MKTIALHPLSVLAGLALAVVAAAQLPRHVPPPEPPVFGVVPAAWWVSIHIQNPTTYTVPLDRRFVVTRTQSGGSVLADGQSAGGLLIPVDETPIADRNGTRVVFQPGTLLTSSNSDLWGYLEPVQ